MEWYWRFDMSYWIVIVGALLLLVAQFGYRFRHSSLWFRSAYLLASIFALAWSALGFYLSSHQKGEHTDLPWSRFWALDHLKSNVGGAALGVFFALVISPEFWRRRVRPHQTSNQPLQRTAGRSED
jgi:purine-cytosine permease-like protein